MTAFSSRNLSVATVPVARADIWAVLTDAELLARLTPLVARIEVDGDRWTWTLAGISALGVSVAPTFTERMHFEPHSRITYTHEPPSGRRERAGANGVYELMPVGPDVTRLRIDISLCVELPLPGFSRRAVEAVMATTMQRTGDGFAANLYAHLGIDPGTVEVDVLEGAAAQ